jgi:hypothetical protein
MKSLSGLLLGTAAPLPDQAMAIIGGMTQLKEGARQLLIS